ncbi:MAG: aminotransferase class III-fold pyridoxal phosphate-dependent enzyme [Acidobacteriia bacterium]|nr:aminotransferase class III-fold pyridoxal phosphate-dependent enzyme [Terriglobia bacterium]
MITVVEKAPRFSQEDAIRLAAEFYGLRVTAEALTSERDQNFRLGDAAGAQFVLKIANAGEAVEVLDLQNQAMRFLAARDTGLAWPQVVAARSGESIVAVAGHFVRLLTWVEGECFARIQPRSAQLLSSLGGALASVDAALEQFSHPAAHRAFHWDLRQAAMARPHLELLPAARRRMVEPFLDACERLEWNELRSSVIYGDANDHNILVDGAGERVVSFLDFGDMVHSATVCDLAVALAYVMLDERQPIAAAAQVVAAYHATRPLTAPEIGALYTLAVGRLCLSVCYSACQARRAPDNAYLNISEAPAWALLERLTALPAGWADDVVRRACRPAVTADLVAARRAHLGPSLSLAYREPLHMIRGRGPYLYDAGGRAYLDCVNNVAHVGHSHPRVVRAASEQMALLNTNTRYLDEHRASYLERLAATLPEPLRVVYLVCSGSEANELAWRLARAHTGGSQAIVVDAAYHGNSSALIDLSPYKFNGPGGRGRPEHVRVVTMPDVYRGPHRGPDAGARYAAAVAEAVRQCDGLAAFFCESALGCGGQIILPAGYLREAFAAVRAAGGVAVADEVQTGFGRAGSHFWMFQTQGVVPDIVTMGKPIGNGHPMGAVVTTPEIAASFANGMEYFNTFGGNPVSCAVGLAVLDVIRDEGLQANARDTGGYLQRGLVELAGRHALIGDVRGVGLFLGCELVRGRETREPAAEAAAEMVERMKDRGVLLSTDGPSHNVIKIKPPLVFSRADADLLLERMDEALRMDSR